MSDTVTSIESLDRELQSFQKLLHETLENESILQNQMTDMQVQLRSLKEENFILSEENVRLTAIVHDRLGFISNFVQEFQKNIQDVLNYQRNKQEVLNTLKELMEKNVKYEKEIKRLNQELEEKKEQTEVMQNMVSKFEGEYVEKLSELKNNIEGFFQQSVTTYNKNIIYEQSKKLHQKDIEINALSLEHGKLTSALNNKLNQKQMELDLLRIDYQQLLQDSINNKQPKIKEIEISTDRKRRDTAQTIIKSKSTSSSDFTTEKHVDRKNNRKGANKKQKASYFEDSMIKHFK